LLRKKPSPPLNRVGDLFCLKTNKTPKVSSYWLGWPHASEVAPSLLTTISYLTWIYLVFTTKQPCIQTHMLQLSWVY